MFYQNLSFRSKFKFCLNVLLFDLIILLLSPRLTGLPLHEIIGFLIFLPIITHIIIEWRWFVNYCNRFFSNSTKRDKFNLLLNSVFFIAIIFQIFSGLLISQVLLPFFKVKTIDDSIWRVWHAQFATITMFLVGFHLALNFNKILYYFKKRSIPLIDKKETIIIKLPVIIFRLSILILLTGFVMLVSLLILRFPTTEHLYTGDAVAEYRPKLINGVLQLLSQIIFVIITCFIARKWLKIRL
jgi:hypothetical protein